MDSTSSFIGHLYSELSQNSNVNLGIGALARRGCIEKLQRTKLRLAKTNDENFARTTLVCYDFRPTNFSSANFSSIKKLGAGKTNNSHKIQSAKNKNLQSKWLEGLACANRSAKGGQVRRFFADE